MTLFNPAIVTEIRQILTLDNVETLAAAVVVAFENDIYAFNQSTWFIDVDDKFRVFAYDGTDYIAKKVHSDKAVEEVEKSREALKRIDEEVIVGKRIKIIVPQIIAIHTDTAYVVSEYVGADLNDMSYRSVKPHISAHEYVEIVRFLMNCGIVHPGFVPRNCVDDGNVLYLFDWEDAFFNTPPEPAVFDRLWYTNFILNWSYLFPRDELEFSIKALIAKGDSLTEPNLAGYEKTFRDLVDFKGSTSEMRNLIEKVVFKAEMPIEGLKDTPHFRPNDMGHLFADVYFNELDVLNDMSSSALRTKDELLYSAINKLATQIISLCRTTSLNDIDYYCMLVVLAILSPKNYSVDDYVTASNQQNLKSIGATLIELKPDSIVSLFLTAKLQAGEIDTLVHGCIKAATGFLPSETSMHVQKITHYIYTLQEEKNA